MNAILGYIAKFLPLAFNIAQGIQAIHAEKDVVTKTQLTQDSVALAVAGAQSVLPPEEAALAGQAGAIVSGTVGSVVDFIHNLKKPAPAPAAAAPAPTLVQAAAAAPGFAPA